MPPSKGDVIDDDEFLFLFSSLQPPEQGEEVPHAVYLVGHGQSDPSNMSMDWERFRPNPKTSVHYTKYGKQTIVRLHVCQAIKNPSQVNPHGRVIQFPDWKQIPKYDPVTAEEDPINGANEAHSLLCGKKKQGCAILLAKHSRIVE